MRRVERVVTILRTAPGRAEPAAKAGSCRRRRPLAPGRPVPAEARRPARRGSRFAPKPAFRRSRRFVASGLEKSATSSTLEVAKPS